ncbi:MAG: MarR family transcriptional regulator [Promicromonosporaceae bacterium]|nr:MarR family transcriptional regulator [Promicromonosporaceae bacterium]
MASRRTFTADERRTWVPFAALLELLPRQLDAQLLRDEGLTHFDYFTLSILAASEHHTLRMTELASLTSATLPRLSRVVTKLEDRGLVRREPCPGDRRATNAVITQDGRRKVLEATPGHVANVRDHVLGALDDAQQAQLRAITEAVLARLDPEGRTMATHREPR